LQELFFGFDTLTSTISIAELEPDTEKQHDNMWLRL
jgi:hypothetical protein